MRVLHVPFTYGPDPVGGTEVYVAGLADLLRPHGVASFIAAPGEDRSRYCLDGNPIFRFPTRGFDGAAYGQPDPIAAEFFDEIVEMVQPDVIHLHARTSAVSELLFDSAQRRGVRSVFTYHTPTVSCLRGTMMERGLRPCNGRLDGARCTACVLQKHGVVAGADHLLASTPTSIGAAAGRLGLTNGVWRALSMRHLVANSHSHFTGLVERADRVVAVCDWVADVLRQNGLSEPKLVVSRQGLPVDVSLPVGDAGRERGPNAPLRIAYFGRMDESKGVDVLVKALRRARGANAELSIFGVAQPGSERFVRSLRELAAGDPRIVFREPIAADQVIGEMSKFDVVGVPSKGMETGPLVVLEAFAARAVVLGSDLGGIAELVRDGVDGLLLPPGDVSAWGRAISSLAQDGEGLLARLRAGVRPPRTMAAVAREMAELYASLLDEETAR